MSIGYLGLLNVVVDPNTDNNSQSYIDSMALVSYCKLPIHAVAGAVRDTSMGCTALYTFIFILVYLHSD